MAIDRPQAIDDAPLGAEAQRRMAAARLSWLARNGRSRGPRACGVASPGEESLTVAIAARRSRLCRPAARSRHQEAAGVARQTALQGEDVADMVRARGPARRTKEQKPWRTERRSQPSGISPALALQTPGSVGCGQRCCSIDALARAALLTVRFDDRHPPITQPDT